MPNGARLAAAWVWLDATGGGLSGGPFSRVHPKAVVEFDRALTPDGRLTLRAWWTELLHAATDDVTRLDGLPTGATFEGRRADVV